MKLGSLYVLGGSLIASFLTTAPVSADTINFSQFGPPATSLPGTISGVTTGGVGVTLTSPNNSFETFVEASHALGAGTWEGTFPSGAPLLYDGSGSGGVELTFADPITSLTLAAQANAQGDFTETIDAFDGATLVNTITSGTIFNCADLSCEGTQAFLTVAAAAITGVTISTTNDDVGLALYGGAGANATPLPAALPLFASGLGALGMLGWRRRRRQARGSLLGAA